MTFDVCVPAYNESRIIKETVGRIRAALTNAHIPDWRIIVADNASIDGTGDRVRSLKDPYVQVVEVSRKGKGSAVIACARMSNASYFGFIDADLSASPVEIAPMIRIIEAHEADIVIGSRLLDKRMVRRGLLRTLSSKVFNAVRYILVGVRVQDSQCGLKVMNTKGREILGQCKEEGWFFDIEFLARAERAGLHILEVPISWNEFQYEGRVSKLRLVRDGVGALLAMMRIRSRLG